MKKYLTLFKTVLQLAFIHRGRALIWLVWDILPPIIMLLFWQVAFVSKKEIAGYNINSMFIYYLLVMFIRTVIFTHPDEALQRSITTGGISLSHLLKPINVLYYYVFYESAYKVIRLFFILPIITLFILFYPNILGSITITPLSFFFFILFITFSFFLFFLIKIIIGLSSFWFNEIGWLQDLSDFLLPLFGGTLFPLEFLPKKIYQISLWLPFRFEVFVPVQIFLGKIRGLEYLIAFSIQFFWIFLFLILIKYLWRKGIKAYNAYGG